MRMTIQQDIGFLMPDFRHGCRVQFRRTADGMGDQDYLTAKFGSSKFRQMGEFVRIHIANNGGNRGQHFQLGQYLGSYHIASVKDMSHPFEQQRDFSVKYSMSVRDDAETNQVL